MKCDKQCTCQPTGLQHLLNEVKKSPGMSISEDEEKETGSPLLESTAQMTRAKLKTRPRLIVTEGVTSGDGETPLRKL
jgi:hypothetical protein